MHIGRVAPTVLALISLLGLAVGCAESAEETVRPSWYAAVEDAQTDPESMWTVPDVVGSGESVDVYFGPGIVRGTGFVLESRGDAGWEWRYAFSSDPYSSLRPNVWSADEFVSSNVQWDSGPAFDGAEAHVIPMPADAEPGRWRLCTVLGAPTRCAEFEVIDSAN